MVKILLDRVLALANTVQDAVMAKGQDCGPGGGSARCYSIRGHAGGIEVELSVDHQRFVVWQYKEINRSSAGRVEIAMKMKLVELNQQVADSLFHFTPDPGWSEVGMAASRGDPIRTGERAASFSLKTLDGESVALENLRGNVVVIDFWATWCMPCRAEFPALEKLRSDFAGAVRFYGVSDESPATVKKYVEEYGYAMPVLIDDNRVMHRRYGIHKIPVLFVIDRDSVVRRQFIGIQKESELRSAIRSVLDQTAPNQ
jgi:peroxiredoxin